ASKDEVGYRTLYSRALQLEKEGALLETAARREVEREVVDRVREAHAAREAFYVEQLWMMQEEMEREKATRAFRERVHSQLEMKMQVGRLTEGGSGCE
ncbi:MAG: hypothetical protein SGPRY_012053, partial [Prymnesium sp.]